MYTRTVARVGKEFSTVQVQDGIVQLLPTLVSDRSIRFGFFYKGISVSVHIALEPYHHKYYTPNNYTFIKILTYGSLVPIPLPSWECARELDVLRNKDITDATEFLTAIEVWTKNYVAAFIDLAGSSL